MTAPPLLDRVRALVAAAAARAAPPSLAALLAATEEPAPVPPELPALLWPARAALAGWLDRALAAPAPGGFEGDPAGDLAEATRRWLEARAQFLALGPGDLAALRALHAEALAAGRDALREARTEAELAAALTRATGRFRRALAERVARLGGARDVVSAEYRPELQLEVLGLDPAALLEPILDLGCGADGLLVRALRARGLDAAGIDRAAREGEGVRRGDWLTEPLGPASLGTVISHLGFSLHFLHQHLDPGGAPERYARRYLEILRALRPGGVFAYAPGLPFVEDLLPAAWSVARSAVPAPRPAGAPELAERVPWYACRVTRRG